MVSSRDLRSGECSMSRSMIVEVFAEDAAHEAFLVPFIRRLATEASASRCIAVQTQEQL